MLPAWTTHVPQPLMIGGSWGPSLAQWLCVLDSFHLPPGVGSHHVTSVHRTSLGPACHGPTHTPPSSAQPLCSAWAAASTRESSQSSCCSQWRTNWGRRKWWGALEGTWEHPQVRAQESCHRLPRVWTAVAEMLWDGSMLTLLSSQHHWLWRTHHLLSSPVGTGLPPHWSLPHGRLAHRRDWGPRGETSQWFWKTLFPSVSLAENPGLEKS